jgi:hypothetical protein
LAAGEQANEGGKVEAVLETLHHSGKASGSPGAMLSQGNLNTAALTLFLALARVSSRRDVGPPPSGSSSEGRDWHTCCAAAAAAG